MAFPSPGTPVATAFSTSVTSMAVNMPATVNSGDRLIAASEVRNAVTWNTIPTGWSQLKLQAGGGSVGQLTVFEKIAAGTEAGTTPTWVASTGTTAEWQVIRVTSVHASTASEVASTSGDATNANPPSLTPTGGAKDYLWIEFAGNAATGETTGFTAASTNYTGLQSNGTSSGGSTVNIASATRQLNASSEDPGTLTPNSNRFWAAATVAVYPAAGGSQFTSSQTAGLSFVGAQTRLTSHTQTATLSFSGSLTRVVSHALTASLSFVGVFIKRAGKVANGTLSFSTTTVRFISHLSTGVLNFTGAENMYTPRLMTGTLSFTGAMTKQTSKPFAGTLSFAASITRAIGHTMSASLSFTGSITRAITHGLTAALDFAGAFAAVLVNPNVTVGPSIIFLLDGRMAIRISNGVYLPL